MSEYVDFHYMPLEGKITGKQVLKQTEDAINDLGNKVYSLDIDQSEIDEAIEKSNEAINTANSALAAVTTGRSVWFNNVAEMVATDIEAGVTAETKGYYVANDGGNALYLIRQEKSGDVVDGGSLIALDNGNMAELVTDGTVNVKQFGAIGNGTDDDTTVFHNTSSYAQAKGFVPFVGVATYKITGSVTGTFNSFGEVTITGGGSVDIINLHEVVSDVSDIRDDVVDATANARTYAENAQTSATNASNSASSASTTATQLMNYLATKETITAPAVDPTITISGAAADAEATGDAIKTTNAEMSLFGIDDLLWDNTNPVTITKSGITFTVDKVNRSVAVSGTATDDNAYLTLYGNYADFPTWLTKEKYYFFHISHNDNVFLSVGYSLPGDTEITQWSYFSETTKFKFPSNAVGAGILLSVQRGGTVNTIARPFISDGMTVKELVASETTSLLDHVVASGFDEDTEWTQHMIVNINNGTVYHVEADVSCTEKMIEIPYGAKAYIHMVDGRVAKYDKDGVFIEAIPDMSIVRDVELDSGTVKYFRLGYPNIDIDYIKSNTLVRIVYPNGKVSHVEDIKNTETGVLQTITASGNPVVITNTSARSFDAFSLTNQTVGKNIVVCGKNLFTYYYAKLGIIVNGATYLFDKTAGTLRVKASQPTPSIGISANAELGSYLTTLNGVASYNNFKFVFPQDTYIAISGNCSVPQPYDYPVQLQLIDGTHIWGVGDCGICIKALANVEYGLRVHTMAGWSGDITFRPQVEIGTHPTEFEVFSGSVLGDVDMPLIPTAQGSENILSITAGESVKFTLNNENANIVGWVDRLHNEIVINGQTLTSNTVLFAPQGATIGGVLIYYVSTFTADGLVCVRGISESLRKKADIQITDGTNFWYDEGNGVFINADSTKTYAFRIRLYGNNTFDNAIFKIQVATGVEAVKLFGSRLGTTTIYTNDSSTIDVTATQTTRVEKVESSYNVTQALTELTAGRILSPLAKFKKIKPMVTFIDDDTWSPTLVQRYHDVMASKGVVGNYAVVTKRVDMYDNTTLDMLLEYETEGFGCLYHCYDQNGDETRYWEANNPAYDEDLIKANFMRGLRRMAEYGFSAYKYWVTPYGVNDKFIVNLAKTHGMKCLFNCPTVKFYQAGYVSATGNADRWNISRPVMTLAGGATEDGSLHSIVDACVADKGWLTIVTHANSWGDTDEMDTRLANMVQYCLDAGMEVTSVPVAFETFYPVFLLNELL